MENEMASEVEVVRGVIYDGPRGEARYVRLLRIPDDHVIFELEDSTVTMGEVLAVGVPVGTPRGEAYVVLEPGDREPDA